MRAILQKMNLVWIDDEPILLKSVVRVLDHFGIEGYRMFVSASDFLHHQYAVPTPTILVVDRVMPGMTGEQLCTTLRDDGYAAYTVLTSGYLRGDGSYDCDDYLQKPWTPAELQQMLDRGQAFLDGVEATR